MPISTDIFSRLDWLTKKVKALCCAVDQVKEEAATQAANNPCYVELVWDDIANVPFDTLAEYNGAATGDDTGLATPFTSLVQSGNTQRLYGGSHIKLDTGILADTTHLVSINDPCGTFTVIGDSALRNNLALTFVNMIGVLTVETAAFENDSALSYVNLPNVIVMGDQVLNNCSSLISLDFPKLEQVGYNAFKLCSSVNYINLPKLITAGDSAFSNISNYASDLSLPSLQTAGPYCFNNMYSCTGFNLPKVQDIGHNCFQDDIYATFYYMPKCTNLGGSTGDDGVWTNITNRPNPITVTIPVALMTCDSGNPDGDIVWFTDVAQGNTVNIVTV